MGLRTTIYSLAEFDVIVLPTRHQLCGPVDQCGCNLGLLQRGKLLG